MFLQLGKTQILRYCINSLFGPFSSFLCFPTTLLHHRTMVGRVVGKFRKGAIRDIGGAFSLGMIAGYTYWYYYHIPSVQKRDAFYAKLQASKFSPV